MSTNIDLVLAVPTGDPAYRFDDFTIPLAVARRLLEEHGDDLPESSFLGEIVEGMERIAWRPHPWNPSTRIVSWDGEGSGGSVDLLLHTVLPKTRGPAHLVLLWENGRLAGVRTEDGRVTVHEVNLTLGREIPAEESDLSMLLRPIATQARRRS